jgi:hypothetical protein
MTVIARDAVASDHLVYAWPFPIGPECEVSCADDEQVVMCPAWLVGDRLGPGRHVWRTPDPTRPVSAFFVLTAPVEVSYDMTTMFLIPSNGQPIRVRACGSLQIRCADPGLLIAQFVGLPFDGVNEGVLRSVARSVERMLARLLTRRVIMAGTPYAVTDPTMLPGILEELVAYNPTAGAVFGVELIRMGHLTVVADDGSSPHLALPDTDWSDGQPHKAPPNGDTNRHQALVAAQQLAARTGDISLVDTQRGRPGSDPSLRPPIPQSSPGITPPPMPPPGPPPVLATPPAEAHPRPGSQPDLPPRLPPPPPAPRRAHAIEIPRSTEDITQPGVHTPAPGAMRIGLPTSHLRADATPREDIRGSILGVGMSAIGHTPAPSVVSGEIAHKVPPGARVLVPGPNGLMQSATVRQLLQGYYELEVGSSGETIWVPVTGVVPEH